MNLIYLDQFHFFNSTIMPENPVIVKVGVDGIDDLVKARYLYKDARIIAYEACPDNFGRWESIAKSGLCEFHNEAVGAGGPITLYRFKNHVGNSIYARHTKDPNVQYVDHIQVQSVTLKGVVELAGGKIDLLIMNCEGGELPIMRELYDDELREKVAQICVSFHDPRIYDSGKKNEILSRLEPYYHIERGQNCPYIPDYLMIRKVGK